MSHWWFCCSTVECPICADNWAVLEEGTDIGDCPRELSGAWQIVKVANYYLLQEDGNSGAVALTAARSVTVNMTVRASINCIAGTKPRILIGAVDEENYFYIEFDVDLGLVTFGKVFEGVPSIEGTAFGPCEEGLTYHACLNEFGTLSVYQATWLAYACVEPFPNGRRAGLGNGTGTAVRFWSFGFDEHKIIHPSCLACMCTCGGRCVPRSLTATVRDTGGCANLDGYEIELFHHIGQAIPPQYCPDDIRGGLLWCPGEDVNCVPVTDLCEECYWSFFLYCDVDIPEDWNDPDAWQKWMWFNLNDANSPEWACRLDGEGGGHCRRPKAGSCDPFWLTIDGLGADCWFTPSGGGARCSPNCCCDGIGLADTEETCGGTFEVDIMEAV